MGVKTESPCPYDAYTLVGELDSNQTIMKITLKLHTAISEVKKNFTGF